MAEPEAIQSEETHIEQATDLQQTHNDQPVDDEEQQPQTDQVEEQPQQQSHSDIEQPAQSDQAGYLEQTQTYANHDPLVGMLQALRAELAQIREQNQGNGHL